MDGHPFVIRGDLSETQAEIVRHAALLFGQFGYTKTNIGEIAERVGMSPGNLYRYYRNKQAIGEEVVRCYLSQSETVMTEAVAAKAGAEARLRAMFEVGIDSLLVAIREHPRMLELADMICAGDSDILHTHIEWKIGMFEMLLREGVAEGLWRVDDPPALAETLLDATRSFWTPMSVAYLDPAGVPDRVQGVLDVILAGIRA